MAVVARERVDGLVAVGGGSTIGLAKAIALRTGLPQVAIPTTYAGSEMTDILGETEGGAKTTRRSEAVRPEAVIYDVELTRSLPPGLSATSGLNAIAHAAEALYARDGNPVIALMAEEGVRALAAALPAIVADPGDMAARGDALYGAWLCGLCLGSGEHGAAPQARPRPRRQLRPAACRDPRRPAAARRRLQRPRGARGDGAARPRARRQKPGRRRSSTSPAGSARRVRCATSACPRTASTAPSRPPSPTPTGTPGRSRPGRSERCSPTPGRDGRRGPEAWPASTS